MDETANGFDGDAEQIRERIRQERETFDQHKNHDERQFLLRLRIGYVALVALPAIFMISLYVLLRHAEFPTSVVVAATGTLFVDAVSLFVGIVKVIFNRKFMTRLAPVTPATSTGQAISKTTVEKPELVIHSALYGAKGKTNDVASVLRKHTVDGKLSMVVGNQLLGPDPCEGTMKKLEVTYSYGDKMFTVSVDEYKTISIP